MRLCGFFFSKDDYPIRYTVRSLFRITTVLIMLLGSHDPAGADVIKVAATDDLQAAIDRASAGDTVALEPRATFVGNFVLRQKRGEAFITLTTDISPRGLPQKGERVQPDRTAGFAKLKSPNGQPALRTAAAAHHWRIQLIEFLPTAGGRGEIIALGDGGSAQRDLASVPHDLEIDRCYVHGDPEKGQKRGIALNSASTTITGSYISEIKSPGEDSQAIGGWNGPGPYRIENNYLEAAGENFMLGGSDPAIPNLVSENVVFRNNHLAKPVAWRAEKWSVKNLFELKNARNVLVEGNLMEYVWRHAQVGYAILLTPRNQDGAAPWATVEDVTIRNNVIRHAGGGVQVTGEDDNHPSGSTRRVTIVNNVFWDIDGATWGGPGAFLLIGNGPADLTVEHNTVLQSGNIVQVYGGSASSPAQVPGFVFRDNIVRHNQYGVHGDNHATGTDTLQAFFPGVVFVGNVIAGGDERRYPPGNHFPGADDLERQFVDPRGGNFALKGDSRLRGSASHGSDPGATVAPVSGTR